MGVHSAVTFCLALQTAVIQNSRQNLQHFDINSRYDRLKIYISGPVITISLLPLSLQNTRFLTFGYNITHPPIYHHSVLLARFFAVKTKYV